MDAQILLNANSKTTMDLSLCNYSEISDISLNKNSKKSIRNALIKVQSYLPIARLSLMRLIILSTASISMMPIDLATRIIKLDIPIKREPLESYQDLL